MCCTPHWPFCWSAAGRCQWDATWRPSGPRRTPGRRTSAAELSGPLDRWTAAAARDSTTCQLHTLQVSAVADGPARRSTSAELLSILLHGFATKILDRAFVSFSWTVLWVYSMNVKPWNVDHRKCGQHSTTVDKLCCRLTNYELLRWLVETPSRDFAHYRLSGGRPDML